MEHLTSDTIAEIRKTAENSELYLFLDFDGTLAPIRRDPDSVVVSREIRDLLGRLSVRKNYKVAIVTGRSLKDIKERLNIEGIDYVGNHGFESEIGGRPGKPVFPGLDKVSQRMRRLGERIRAGISHIPGAIVEDKGLSISVHYRMVERDSVEHLEKLVIDITSPLAEKGEVKVTGGKKIWEIRPPFAWNKGTMVSRLLDQQRKGSSKQVVPVYIGDDRTDEDAFRALAGDGYSIKVCRDPVAVDSLAEYYLKGLGEVKGFLKALN